MNILDKIVAHKKEELILTKQQKPVHQLIMKSVFLSPTVSLKNEILKANSTGIIAEYKRKSPSKGVINKHSSVVDVVTAYQTAGVAGCSVLTEENFFGGSKEDFIQASKAVTLPLLRKDFMIDEYQFVEAKSIGADVVLLIASILSPPQVMAFTDLAKSLGMEVLLELHDESELNHVYHKVDMVGINNRNLKTFEVDIEQSVRMAEKLGNDFVKIAESGISDIDTLKYFKQNGFHGFLIGENFMKTDNPGKACSEFIQQL